MLPKILTLEYLSNEKEGQYLDRKSARIKPSDIARHIVAFANANGGVLAIGIEDNGEITGFNNKDSKSINDFLNVPFSSCKGRLKVEHEIRKVTIDSKQDSILLLFIEPSEDAVIKTSDDKVYLRVGDKSKLLNHEQVTQLEYDKGERIFEDIIVEDSSIDDVDLQLLQQYKEKLGTSLSYEEILDARGLLKKGHLTNAGILLFAKHPTKFLPNARLRLLKFDGTRFETGQRLNIIKEINYEDAIPKIIQQVKNAITLQLREFQYLDENGVFKVIPEYPEFAWFEGIVNSLTHRNYSIMGDHIRVSLYDDRLEILSPGKLPNIVTLDNMLNTRYSRNPRIARVLGEFGWVKELNEGVKRIYDEMQMYFLKSPTYSEPNGNSVLLVLENSITSRQLRTDDKISSMFDQKILGQLNEFETTIIQFLTNNKSITIKTAKNILHKGDTFSRKQLKHLEELDIIEWHGSNKSDPTQYYTLKSK
ncbi:MULTISPECIES: ATP-binding protein [Faecalicoccus]|uniref:ATP-binding protein n=1 Tax=Faecalicoccus pleomorphus TaxID=1323 RepID=A0AAW6CRW3_9FIRM|nr:MULTISPECIES: ATP-binding protein [Faecalicoccus]MDB7980353.1 ATP-binding protein [Faecalicoccus pleomorphus]MDB7982328.1 ATP-binding protein [Faecalicoccus pleomorphus]MDY4277640.1 ATP-binding protein [Faecalicoccus sp.]